MHVRETLSVSERRACRVLGQVRRTQRYTPKVADDEEALTENIVSLATEYGRYGYRRITALLKTDGWRVNHKRVERIWRQEGMKVPAPAEERAAVVQRRVLYPASTGASQPRLGRVRQDP